MAQVLTDGQRKAECN